MELFEELARIFSEDNNQWAQRELLMREGTAKFADTVGENDRQLQKVFQRQLNNSGVSSCTIYRIHSCNCYILGNLVIL